MKIYKYIAIFLLSVVSFGFVKTDAKSDLDAQLALYKKECKDLIKPARYEGSRTTYFTRKKKTQKKSVEVYLVMDSEYHFALSGKACAGIINLRVFDFSDEDSRTLVYEQKAIQGKNVVFNSSDLNATYRKKVPNADRLKNLVIEYEVAAGEDKLEGIILVIGNK
ncbi:MAG: hypothetical protein E6Q37_00760 [Crocinitomicaceae bacterium]|nr:MAG: hypothetical protein E6Q37_00760 [Crocinitomicaceae bacterium]